MPGGLPGGGCWTFELIGALENKARVSQSPGLFNYLRNILKSYWSVVDFVVVRDAPNSPLGLPCEKGGDARHLF